MFVLVAAVPALMVVVVGYVVGFAATEWLCTLVAGEPAGTPEVAGWITGLVLLAVVARVLVALWRRRRKAGGHQK
ncbi:hypothetical protein [Blastococcus montanus]|uniref:hypothetical protein n=1 Tax=Blastococcus montanus TaxID=3144973 RepID=UPI003209F06A